MATSPALKWDEAQQIVWSQYLQWGYGAQPPLYTWLQWGVNQALGPSVLALALLKHALIALTCVFMWLAGREMLGRRAAWWAAASLLLLPPFGWYSIRDHTHTVLVTTMVCAALWLLLRIVRRQGRDCVREFIALGVVCGCGMLAKYSFALALAALAVALLSVAEARRALFGRGWWWTPLIALILFAPHGAWVLSHWQAATAVTLKAMDIAPQHRWGAGLLDLLSATASTLGLWALLALAAFGALGWRRPADAPQPWAWLRPVFARYLAVLAVALLAMVFVGNVTVFKGRWVLPLLAPVPLLAFALRPDLESSPRGHRFTVIALALVLAMLAASGARPWVAYFNGSVDELNHPAPQLAQALQGAGYDGQGRIIACDRMLAGTLRTRFPAAPVAFCAVKDGDVPGCVAAAVQQAERAGQGWLIISRADEIDKITPPWWSQALAQLPGSERLPRASVQIPFLMARPDHAPASYDFVWQPARR